MAYGNETRFIMNQTTHPTVLSQSTSNSDLSSEEEMDSNISRSTFEYAAFVCSVFMLICCIVGLFGNAMSVLIYTRPVMRSSINVLLTGLSLIDLLMLATSIPVFVLPNFDMFFKETLLPSSYLMIIIFGPYQFGMIAQTSSVWTFVLISCERYLAVCHPLKVSRLLSVKRARLALLGVVFTAVAYNIVRFFEYGRVDWSTYNHKNTDMNTNPEPITAPSLLRDEKFYFVFYHIGLYLITHFLGPFLIIAVLNFLIWMTMRKSKQLRASLMHNGEDGCLGGPGVCGLNGTNLLQRSTSNINSPRKLHRRTRTKTTQMIVVVTAMFLCCNVLPFMVNIWEAITPDVFVSKDIYLKATAFLVVDLSNTLVVFNSASTFLLYLVYCKKYRQLFKWYCLGPFRLLTGDVARFGGHYPLLLSHRSSSFDTTQYLGFMKNMRTNKTRRTLDRDTIASNSIVSTAVIPIVTVNDNSSQSPASIISQRSSITARNKQSITSTFIACTIATNL